MFVSLYSVQEIVNELGYKFYFVNNIQSEFILMNHQWLLYEPVNNGMKYFKYILSINYVPRWTRVETRITGKILHDELYIWTKVTSTDTDMKYISAVFRCSWYIIDGTSYIESLMLSKTIVYTNIFL